jgi:hypothetical protein
VSRFGFRLVCGGILLAASAAASWAEPAQAERSGVTGETSSPAPPELLEASDAHLLDASWVEELLGGDTSEGRYFALADSLGALLAAGPENLDEVSRVEIDAMAAVAEELLLEGEVEIAASLVEGALLLLSEEEGME